jgi:AraC family transcriptional regulator
MSSVNTPGRTTAAAYPRYLTNQVLGDSEALHWPGLFVRRYRCPRVVDRFLVPATPEPLISCGLAGSAEFEEREVDGTWVTRKIGRGDLFVTRSVTPYEVRFSSAPGQEMEIVQVHVGVDFYLAALEELYPGQADRVEVIDYFGRDEALAHLCLASAELLAERTPGTSKRIAQLTQLLAMFLVEKYTDAAAGKPDLRGGLPIRQLRKIEDYVSEHLAAPISVEMLAGLVELSPFHFSRVFKQATGMTPLQFVTRERITRAQQFIRETSRSLIEIGLEVGYASPSHFARVFRQMTGTTPTSWRKIASGRAGSRETVRAGGFMLVSYE